MPSTQELITTIIDDFHVDIGRTRVLAYLDRAQRRMFSYDCAQTVFYNTSDPEFPWPILSTTAGTLSYDLSSCTLLDSDGSTVSRTVDSRTVTIRRINKVFVDSSDWQLAGLTRKYYGGSIQPMGINPYWTSQRYANQFYEIPGIITDRNNDFGPTFTFGEDPGTHTDLYYIEMFYNAPELTAETTPMFIDADVWEEALIDGVVGYIEDWRNGESKRLDRFRNYWLKKFWNSANEGSDQKRPLKPMARPCL